MVRMGKLEEKQSMAVVRSCVTNGHQQTLSSPNGHETERTIKHFYTENEMADMFPAFVCKKIRQLKR